MLNNTVRRSQGRADTRGRRYGFRPWRYDLDGSGAEAGEVAAVSSAEKAYVGGIEAFGRPGSTKRAIADISASYKGEVIFSKEFMQLEL
jgi:hypothetical protein